MSTLAAPPATSHSPAVDWNDGTVAALLRRLGGIPAERVRLDPPPGTATDEDAIAAERRYGRLCELVDGTLVEKPVGFGESAVATTIGRLIGNFVAPLRLGVVAGEQGMMRVVPGRLRMPDVSFTSWARLPADYQSNAAPRVSPDLAVEVLSPGHTAAEMSGKRSEYFAGGTRLVWIVDPPTRTLAAYRPGQPEPAMSAEGDKVGGGDVLPGFTLDLTEVFAQAERPPTA